MKIFSLTLLLLAITSATYSQLLNAIINEPEIRRIETVLSGDAMRGRKTFTQGAEKAASFISNEFKKAGLQTLAGSKGYKQPFSMVKTKLVSVSASFENGSTDPANIVAFTCSPDLKLPNTLVLEFGRSWLVQIT